MATKPIDVIGYSPYRDGQQPGGAEPTEAQVRQDLSIIATLAKGIRIYSTTGIHAEIPRLAKNEGLEVWLGAWINKDEVSNQEQIDALIEQAKSYKSTIKGLIVGSEVLFRKDLTPAQLVRYIQQVKDANTDIPVSTAEIYGIMKDNKAVLAPAIDFVTTHIHPYWDGPKIDDAAEHVAKMWDTVRVAYPGKEVIVGETGFPTAGIKRGAAQPSLDNQVRVTVELIAKSKQVGMKVMLFSAFDEKWKVVKTGDSDEGLVGGSWGLWGSNREEKPVVAALRNLPVAIMTPDRKLRVIPAADAALGGIDALGRLRLPSATTGAPAKALPVWTISRP
ncbi:MAG TPA: glycosyl hydrolase family 17 protein [Fibrobacteria bacterium]|nr:glycosyl hydrolase family 17 protein [Fibrobacteria bacterium]